MSLELLERLGIFGKANNLPHAAGMETAAHGLASRYEVAPYERPWELLMAHYEIRLAGPGL